MVAEEGTSGRARRSQEIARGRRRRRRPNITGEKRLLEVTVSEDEFEAITAAAEEANCTVPWFMVQSATNPAPAAAASGGRSGPWVPWPKRQAIVAALLSATGALDEIRLAELAKIGGNINQIAHSANISGTVGDELIDLTAELRETIAEIRTRAEEIEQLAREATRR